MTIRAVRDADEATIRELWEEFEAELPEPPGFQPETWDEAWHDLRLHARDGVALLADDEEGPVGYAFARAPEHGRAHVTDVYVRPRARRRGVASELLRELAEGASDLGARWLSLDVLASNMPARTLYEQLGFEQAHVVLAAPVDTVLERLGARRDGGESYGAAYVQSDDQGAVVAAVERFVPRLHRSGATVVSVPANGWVAVHDDAADRDPRLLRRLGQELSHVTGTPVLVLGVQEGGVVRLVAFERGHVLDEYLSVPGYFGPVPPGDAVALRANATVLARLTGAEPRRIREVARTAASPADLPPAAEHALALAETLGLPGAYGFADAAREPGAAVVEH
ncbi:MAG: GNAT family N-acetyltransferase [Thermoleophilia bacterium]|nr:GNAT family N-acetyltransferase [Thermoleophilia bacterium]